jgi:HEAT repeat protein
MTYVRLGLLVLLFTFGIVVASSSGSDTGPTPEDKLRRAGIALTIPAMTGVLADPQQSVSIRYNAAIALGNTREPEVSRFLIAALDDEESDIRIGALFGLRALDAEGSVSHLLSALRSDGDPGVRLAAVSALSTIRTQRSADALVEVALNDLEQEHIRYNAIFSLGELGIRSATSDLSKLLTTPEPNLRIPAAVAVANLGDPRATSVLVDELLSTNPNTQESFRVDAARAFENISGEHFAYPNGSEGSAADRDKAYEIARRRIRDWWDLNASRYQ